MWHSGYKTKAKELANDSIEGVLQSGQVWRAFSDFVVFEFSFLEIPKGQWLGTIYRDEKLNPTAIKALFVEKSMASKKPLDPK